ncbi:unnamed protein product [Urochloa decumbens]|uniref:F-box domain-containing protein n=1 Tax=Urochloa decumbens TaxID=240449 RepID=A0ABC9E575_9POAL
MGKPPSIAKLDVVDGEDDEGISTLESPLIIRNHTMRKRLRSAHDSHKEKKRGTSTMGSTKMDTTTLSMLLMMAKPQGWAELPDQILDSIIQLLSSTCDLIAFIGTCTTWRAVFMEAKHSYCNLFPPLMIQSCAQLSNDVHSEVHHTWQLMDPANPSLRIHRPAPTGIPSVMDFVGCSYGHAIFADLSDSNTEGCITLVDVFTGVQVSPPPCPAELVNLICCALTGPISSPKTCLLVSVIGVYGLFVWRIWSKSWQLCSDSDGVGLIDQIVVFKDRIIVLDSDLSIFTVNLDDDPEFGMYISALLLIIKEDNDDMVNNEDLENVRLMVVPGDKLALVALPSTGDENLLFFYLEDLDSPKEPPRWSPVHDLDCTVFISGAYERSAVYNTWYGRWVLSSADPERWGGRRGQVKYAGYSDEVYPFASGRLLPSWVTPSALFLDG